MVVEIWFFFPSTDFHLSQNAAVPTHLIGDDDVWGAAGEETTDTAHVEESKAETDGDEKQNKSYVESSSFVGTSVGGGGGAGGFVAAVVLTTSTARVVATTEELLSLVAGGLGSDNGGGRVEAGQRHVAGWCVGGRLTWIVILRAADVGDLILNRGRLVTEIVLLYRERRRKLGRYIV